MKAICRFQNEFRWVDLAYVDKLAKDNKGVKYLPIRHDFLDRTVDARGFKKKFPKQQCELFYIWLQKRINPIKYGLTKEQKLLESLKKFAAEKEYLLMYNEWDKGFIYWTYDTILEKCSLPLHGRSWIMDTSTITDYFNSSQPWTPEIYVR